MRHFIKTIQTTQTSTKGTHPNLPVVIFVKSVDVTIGTGIDFGITISLEAQVAYRFEICLERHQSVHRSYPHSLMTVLYQIAGIHVESVTGIVFHTMIFIVEAHLSALFLNQIESSVQRSHPDAMVGILIGHINIVAADGIRIPGIMTVMSDAIPYWSGGIGSQFYQSVSLGREPEILPVIIHGMINAADLMMGIIEHLLHPALHIQQINILAAGTHQHITILQLANGFHSTLITIRQRDDSELVGGETDTVNTIISRSEPQQSVLVQVHVQEVAIWFMVLELRKESQVNAFHRLRINIDNFASTGKIEVTVMRGGDELRLHHLTYARNRITALPSGLRITAHQSGMRLIQLPHTSVRGMINKMFLRFTGEILLPHAERPLPVFRSNRNGINLIILSYIVGT